MSAAITARTAIRSPRAAAVAGIVVAVLLAAALVRFGNAAPSDPGAAGNGLADAGRRNAVVVALNLLPFAAIAFVAMTLWAAAITGGLLCTAEDSAIAASQPRI